MRYKSGGITLIVVLLMVSFISATVYINEVETNPSGSDAGNEWIEVYNNGADVNLSGWSIKNDNNDYYFFDGVIIGQNQFYVLDNLNGLVNTDESLTLYTKENFSMDTSGQISDNDDDGKTLQRIPDGSGSFNLISDTKNLPNEQVDISGLSSNPSCILAKDKVNLYAIVTCDCVDKVVFSVKNGTGSWINVTGSIVGENNYTGMIDTNLLDFGSSSDWKVYAYDIFNRSTQSSIESFYVTKQTGLTVSPSAPNGFNGWYISEPLFIVYNSDAYLKFYRWNGNLFNYIGSFGLEGTPNSGNITGGIHVLNYWSNFSCGRVESQINQTFKFDFTSPQIIDNSPIGQITNDSPKISAYIDEVYQSNSGVNLSSFKMFLNDVEVNSSARNMSALDGEISYQTLNLDNGIYEVKVEASDKSGRMNDKSWTFEIFTPGEINLTIINPNESIYGERKIQFILTTEDEAEEIGYFENIEGKTPRKRKLCNNCDSYGLNEEKRISFREGNHNLTFYARNKDGVEEEENYSFLIDSTIPRFKSTSPKNGYADGNFSVIFEETNPKKLTLYYGNSSDLNAVDYNISECNYEDSPKIFCSKFIDLSFFDGEDIQYYFSAEDIVENIEFSKVIEVKVDSTDPLLVNPGSFYDQVNNYINFHLNVEEDNFDTAVYSYINYRGKLRERKLCSILKNGFCEKRVSFRSGSWDLVVKITDEA
ncbi:hypothetical protein COU57_01305, partial [Candidatus Pacearchaeota archaeon CG10_big_fil_rev_8_21_14_0_10_32_14]